MPPGGNDDRNDLLVDERGVATFVQTNVVSATFVQTNVVSATYVQANVVSSTIA